MEEAVSSQSPKVFPAGNAARLRRVRRLAASRPAASSASRTRTTSAGSQRWALAVGTRSVRVRRRCGSLSRRVSSIASASGSPAEPETVRSPVAITPHPLRCRWRGRCRRPAGVGRRSTRPTFPVGGCDPRRRGWVRRGRGRPGRPGSGSGLLGEPAHDRRGPQRLVDSALSTSAWPCNLASATASAIFARTRRAPIAAASVSQLAAPGPRATERGLGRGGGLRRSARSPCRAGAGSARPE